MFKYCPLSFIQELHSSNPLPVGSKWARKKFSMKRLRRKKRSTFRQLMFHLGDKWKINFYDGYTTLGQRICREKLSHTKGFSAVCVKAMDWTAFFVFLGPTSFSAYTNMWEGSITVWNHIKSWCQGPCMSGIWTCNPLGWRSVGSQGDVYSHSATQSLFNNCF